MGHYQRELLELRQKSFADSETRKRAIRDWIKDNRAPLQAELKKNRSQRNANPATNTARDLFHAERMKRLQSEGRIGPKQLELMALQAQDFESPVARKAAIRQWLEANREALKAEQALQASQRALSMETQSLPFRESNPDSFRAELTAIRDAEYATPDERRAAMRKWIQTQRAAQRAEAEERFRH